MALRFRPLLICREPAGIQGVNTLYSWFSTSFAVPPNWSDQGVLLHFGAVDYEATVFINGKKAGFNRGGYFHFTVDATPYLKSESDNELYFSHFLVPPVCEFKSVYRNANVRLIGLYSFMTRPMVMDLRSQSANKFCTRHTSFIDPVAASGKASGSSRHPNDMSHGWISMRIWMEKVNLIIKMPVTRC